MARIIVNTKDFTDSIEEMIARAKNATKPLKAFGDWMVGSIKMNFQQQGRPTPWAPLKVNTLVRRFLKQAENRKIKKTGGQFDPNPNVFKKLDRLTGAKDDRLKRYLGETGAASTIAGMARSPKTGRVLRSRHGGYNKFASPGHVFRRPALRAILSGQILIDSGQLRNSISSEMISSQEVAIGTSKEYAGPHQFGHPEGNIPARPFLVLQADDVEEFAGLLTEWISNGERFAA